MKKALFAIPFAAMSIAAVACSERLYMGEVKTDAAPPSFSDPNTHDAAFADGQGPRLECIATNCPAPWTTCISEDGPTYKCGTDLQRDPNHCGACGNKCVGYAPIHMTSRCLSGSCELECFTQPQMIGEEEWRNCNRLVDDGCEVDVMSDANHCGACGNKCPAGVPCLGGQCGCPAGLILCGGLCVDPQTNNSHCGACDSPCEPPPDACDPIQPHTYYGCAAGKCGKKKCEDRFVQYFDCNNDVAQNTCGGDGCETQGLNTKENCGACGKKCTKPNEECVNEGNGFECAVPCERFGKVLCGERCVDLLTDIGNCGACNSGCKPPGPNQERSCRKGVCVYDCAPGWGDCNGDATDGCETNLNVHQRNCGACGVECDVSAGQPCIEGRCLMQECDAGVTK